MVSHESQRRKTSLSHRAKERSVIHSSKEGYNESDFLSGLEIKPLLHLRIIVVDSCTLKGSFAVANSAFDQSPVALQKANSGVHEIFSNDEFYHAAATEQ